MSRPLPSSRSPDSLRPVIPSCPRLRVIFSPMTVFVAWDLLPVVSDRAAISSRVIVFVAWDLPPVVSDKEDPVKVAKVARVVLTWECVRVVVLADREVPAKVAKVWAPAEWEAPADVASLLKAHSARRVSV